MAATLAEDIDFSAIFYTSRIRNLDDAIEFKIFYDSFLQTNSLEVDVKKSNVEGSSKEKEDILMEHKYTIPSILKQNVPKNPLISAKEDKKEAKKEELEIDSILTEPSSDEKISHVERTFMNEYIKIYNNHFLPLVNKYIWTGNPFFVTYVPSTLRSPAHLSGHFRTADNVQENWLVTYLLVELTETCNDISVVVDSLDGNFILIEAADYIPSWLSSETAENRVFLRRGSIYILPKTLPDKYTDLLESEDNSAFNFCKDGGRGNAKAAVAKKNKKIQKIELSTALKVLKNDTFDLYIASNTVQEILDHKMLVNYIISKFWTQPDFNLEEYSKKHFIDNNTKKRVFDSKGARNVKKPSSHSEYKYTTEDTFSNLKGSKATATTTVDCVNSAENSKLLEVDLGSVMRDIKLSSCMRHKCNIIVPVAIARMISEFPQLVGCALDHIPPEPTLFKKCKNLPENVPLVDSIEHEMIRMQVSLNRSQYTHLQSTRFALPLNFHSGFSDSFKVFMNKSAEEDRAKYQLEMTRGLYISMGLLISIIDSNDFDNELIYFLYNSQAEDFQDSLNRFSILLKNAKTWSQEHPIKISKDAAAVAKKKREPLITEITENRGCSERNPNPVRVTFEDSNAVSEIVPKSPTSAGARSHIMTERKSKLKPQKRTDNSEIKTQLHALSEFLKIPLDLSVRYQHIFDYLYHNSTFAVTPSHSPDDTEDWIKDWMKECDDLQQSNPENIAHDLLSQLNGFLTAKSSYEGYENKSLIVDESPDKIHSANNNQNKKTDTAVHSTNTSERTGDSQSDYSDESSYDDDIDEAGSFSGSDGSYKMSDLMKEMDRQLKTIKLGRIRDSNKKFDFSDDEGSIDYPSEFFRENNPADLNDEELEELLRTTMSSSMKNSYFSPSPASQLLKLSKDFKK